MERLSRRDLLKIAVAGLAGYGLRSLSPEQTPVAKATQPDDDRIHRKEDGPVTETVSRNQIVVEQGDSAPIENGVPRTSYRDTDPNSALISIYNWNNDQVGLQVLVDNGDDWAIFTWDDCPSNPSRSFEGARARASQYAFDMRQLKLDGTGATGRRWARADIVKYKIDPAQGDRRP